jgi:hypothetical protein
MPCPFLRTSTPARCCAVSGKPGAPPKVVVATLCRGGHEHCPAFRFTRASGKLVHPADFVSWIVLGIPAGYDDSLPQPG